MKFFFTSLLLSFFVLGTLSAQFVHPGITSSREELDKMKQQVADGSDAARTLGWNKLKSASCSSLSYSPNFRTTVYADNESSGNFGLDALAAYSHALQWYITGNQANADKAISILNGYSSILTSIVTSSASANGNQEVPVAGWAGATFCEAAEIIRYSNAGWSAADITKFENMMINVFYPIVKYHRTENGNWEASLINTMAAMGVFCNRQDIFDQAISWAKGSSRGGITTYIYTSGECQETCRDQNHTMMGIGELIETCEIAWHQGIDLYSWASDANGLPRLAKGLEYTAKVINNVCMPSSCGTKCQSFSGAIPMWETSWNHYGNRMGRTDMQYTKKNAEVNGRPAGITGWQGQFGFQTLTHANMSGTGTPPPPPPSCGNAVPWTNTSIATQTGTFTAEFDAIPGGANMDGAVGLSNGGASTWSDLACVLQFYSDGLIKARNGSAYTASASLAYTAGTSYHVKMVVNVATHKYDIFVTPAGGSQVQTSKTYA